MWYYNNLNLFEDGYVIKSIMNKFFRDFKSIVGGVLVRPLYILLLYLTFLILASAYIEMYTMHPQ